jgi:hypothetical protein
VITTILVAAGALAVGVTANRIATRRRTKYAWAQLDEYAAQLDNRAAMTAAYVEQVYDWAKEYMAWTVEQAEMRHRFDEDTHADDNGHEPQHEDPATVELEPVNYARFAYREPAAVIAAEASILAAEKTALHADVPHLNAIYATAPGEHFESQHITPEMRKILAASRWGTLHGGELTKELTAQRVGMPTGAYPTVKPRGGDDEMPVPTPPTKPATVPAALAPLAIKRVYEAVLAGKAA